MTITTLVWAAFLLLITLVVALDLGVFHRKARVVSLPEAVGWTITWIALALVFNVAVYFLYELNPAGWDMDTEQLSGADAAIQFFTGYLVEKSLSIDNIFVIAMIFSFFRVPLSEQHRVLFWGIFGAIVLRAIMIFLGAALVSRFDWVFYIFGLLLLYSAAQMLVIREDTIDPDQSLVVRLARRMYPVTDTFHGSRFFVKIDGVRHATPLFLALILVEISDITFAVDSIPAIFAITRDPFIVFTSNIFAILGLRSLYFVLAGLMEKFRYLKISLAFLMAYIGVKMMLVHHYPIPSLVSLAVIAGILGVGVVASLIAGKDRHAFVSPIADEFERLALATYRQARRTIILVLGSSVLLIGVLMIALPGPAIIVIPVGLSILAIEFAWAARWLKVFRERLAAAGESAGSAIKRLRKPRDQL